jgi:Icc protein
MVRLAHLSDLHLTGDPAAAVWGLDSAATLTSVVDAFAAVAPVDAAVLTGDLADEGQPGAYCDVAALTRDLAPQVHAVPGNHDDPDAMRDVLGVDGPVRSVALGPAWTLVLVSSRQPHADAGHLDDAVRAQLREQLARARGHVAVALHHPPASTCGGPYCDMVDGAAVVDLLARAGNVRAVLSGHLHRRFRATRSGIEMCGAPSTVVQLAHADDEQHFHQQSLPPAGQLLELGDDGTVQVRLVEARTPTPSRVGNIRPVR